MEIPLPPGRLVCPECGNDGSIADEHGRYPGFQWLEDDVISWDVVGVVGNAQHRGQLVLSDDSEHFDASEPQARILCQRCCFEFTPPCGASDRFEADDEPALLEDPPLMVTGPWRRCSDGCPGWFHCEDPREIQKCDECGRFEYDEDAILAHRIECGCDWPEARCPHCGTHVVQDPKSRDLVCPECDGRVFLSSTMAYYEGLKLAEKPVMFRQEVERFPHFSVPAGWTGVVVEVSRDCIGVELDLPLEGAEEWDNVCHFYIEDGCAAEEFLDDIVEYRKCQDCGGIATESGGSDMTGEPYERCLPCETSHVLFHTGRKACP